MDPLSTLVAFLSTGPADALTTIRGLFGVVLGVGALIFFHELGHFLAAKWAGVRVEVFSLGMGPRLFGVVHKGTDYRVSALPIGGYVSMLGQIDGDPNQPQTDSEGDFRNKSVGKRFVIMIAGVAMNIVLAAVGFVACFGLGVDFAAAEIGQIEPGSAAAKADLRPGDIVTEVDGNEVLGLQDLDTLVAISDGKVELTVERKGETFKTTAHPVRGPNDRYARLGAQRTWVIGYVEPDSPFWKAGLRPATSERDFRWLSVASVTSKLPPGTVMSQRDIDRATFVELKGPIVATFEEVTYDARGRPKSRRIVPMEVNLERKPVYHLGLSVPDLAWVRGTKEGSAAEKAGVKEGDRLVRLGGLEVKATNLSQVVRAVGAREEKSSELIVERDGEEKKLEVSLELQNSEVVAKALEGVQDAAKRAEVREKIGNWLLGVSYRADVLAETCTVSGEDGKPLTLEAGTRLTKTWLTEGTFRWSDKRDFSRDFARTLLSERRFRIAWIPPGETEEKTAVVTSVKHDTRDYAVLGVAKQTRMVTIRCSPFRALTLGVEQTLIQTRRIALMLGAFLTGAVSPRELGGPIQIVNVTYHFATQDSLSKLLHLLAILSVNLAVINVLPIPVLDGGHIFFLLVEKLKGQPVSTQVLINAQWFGLFSILALMALVIFNDIRRLLGS
jgi:regulator of sigma E protease